MYKLKITARAKTQLKKISKAYTQQAVHTALLDIKEDPLFGKTLTRELTGRFSHKVGTYRIIYKLKEKDKVIYIITVGHRSTVYQ